MDYSVIMEVEQRLKKKVLADEFIVGNPIYELMQKAANKFFIRENWKSKIKFHFLYILDYRVNAYTLTFEDYAVICFTTGVMDQITYAFSQMVELEEYHNIFENKDAPKLIADLSVNLFHFLFLHEFGHLACGHTRYLSSVSNSIFMSMFDTVDSQTLLDRQTLELHADIIASHFFGLVVRKNDTSFEIKRLSIALSAIHVLFEIIFLFDRGRFVKNNIYLPSTFRMTNAFGIILREQFQEDIKPVFEKVYEATAKGFYHVFRIKSDSTQTRNKLLRIEDHVASLKLRWQEIYKNLDCLSITNLTADIYDWQY